MNMPTKALNQLTVPELKEILWTKGIDTTGTKSELIQRLTAADLSVGNYLEVEQPSSDHHQWIKPKRGIKRSNWINCSKVWRTHESKYGATLLLQVELLPLLCDPLFYYLLLAHTLLLFEIFSFYFDSTKL